MTSSETIEVGEQLGTSHNITVPQIVAFVTAARCGSFSQAAEQLQLSQSALSRSIKEMESTLNISLFDRTPKGVALSLKGAAFLPLATRLLQAHADAQTGMAYWRRESVTKINLAGTTSIMPIISTVLLRYLKHELGQVVIQISEALSHTVRQQVLDGELALGVCGDIEEHPRLRYTPVLEVQFGLLASASFPWPGPVNSLRDLIGLPLVRCSEQSICTKVLRHHSIDFRAYFESPVAVNDAQAATNLVQSLGMIAVTTGIGATHLQAKGLDFIPLPGLLPRTKVYIVSRRDAVFDEHHELVRSLLHASIHDAPWHHSVHRLGDTSSVVRPVTDASRGPS